MSCRAVLTNAQLETAFSRSWVRKTLEDARRAALVRADQAHSLATQTTLMPLVRLLEVGVLPAVQAALTALKTEEEKLTVCEYARWVAKRDIVIGIGAQAALKAALKAADEGVKTQTAPVKACKATLEERVKLAEELMVVLSLEELANVATRFRRLVADHQDVLSTLSGVDGLVQSVMDRAGDVRELAPAGAAPAAPAPAARLHVCSAAACKGLFDSVTGACMVCQTAHCVRCIQPLPAGGTDGAAVEHRCNPADLATAKYVAASTTACPRCHIAISRVSGCSQVRVSEPPGILAAVF